MIISHRYKFIFIKTIKTAGTSLEVYFSKLAGDNDVLTPIYPKEVNHQAQNFRGVFDPFLESRRYSFTLKNRFKELLLLRKYYNHIPAYLAKERISRKVWNSYFKFCVERNPWDKSVSHFHMMRHRSADKFDFDHYLRHSMLCHNFPLYTDPFSNELLVDRVLRFDRLNDELQQVFSDLGVPFSGSLNVYSKSNYREKNRPYQAYFDLEGRKIIERNFQDEIRLMDFVF